MNIEEIIYMLETESAEWNKAKHMASHAGDCIETEIQFRYAQLTEELLVAAASDLKDLQAKFLEDMAKYGAK